MPSGEKLNTNLENPSEAIEQEPTSRATYEERGEKGYQAAKEQEQAEQAQAEQEQSANRFSQLSREDLLTVNVNELSEAELREYIDANNAWIEKINARISVERERQGLPPETTVSSEPEVSAAANPEAATKDLSGIDVIVADHPENSLETSDELDLDLESEEAPAEVDPNAETVPLVPVITPEEAGGIKEVISREEASATYEKAKRSPKAKNFFAKKVLPIVLSAGILLSSIVGVVGNINTADANDQAPQTPIEQVDQPHDTATTTAEAKEAKHGIQDGYNEKGMFASEHKGGAYDFANAAEVAEVNHNDECDMVKYTAHNQVESMADYLANLPEQLQPDGFKGLNLLETEQKLESLSDAEFEAIQKQFDKTIDDAFTRRVTLNGSYDNAYMRLKDPNGGLTHDNMELVKCTTEESNLEVTQFYWVDDNGNEIGTMTVKMSPQYDESGNIIGYELCMQVVNPEGSTTIYEGAPTITPTPEITYDDDGTGDEGTGSEGTGSEGTGSEDTGSEDTGSEGTGSEDTGSEGTGSEGTGSEGTGSEDTGSEGTGSEDTGSEGTGSEDTGSEGTGSEGTGSEDTGSEGTDIEPKDPENLQRIDDQILDDIADDIGTDEVTVDQTPTEEVENQTPTEQPSAEDYQGTEPEIVQNQPSQEAEPVQDQISDANDYSEDRGGANADQYAPVQANEEAQAAADAAEIPIDQAPTVANQTPSTDDQEPASANQTPTSNQELDDILNDLGIS